MREYWLVSTGDHSALELCESRDEAVRVANEVGRITGETFTIAGPFSTVPSVAHDAWDQWERARTPSVPTYALEVTAPGVAYDCRHADCAEHYVVRVDGLWYRAFHNERDARLFVEDMLEVS